MFRSLLCYVTFEICPMYFCILHTFQKTTTYLLHQNLGKISVQILNSGSWFENRNIVIFCTAQNLMRKKILWFFFSVKWMKKSIQAIHIFMSKFHCYLQQKLFKWGMERWPRYPIFHRIWKKHFCNFRNCSSFIKLDK